MLRRLTKTIAYNLGKHPKKFEKITLAEYLKLKIHQTEIHDVEFMMNINYDVEEKMRIIKREERDDTLLK